MRLYIWLAILAGLLLASPATLHAQIAPSNDAPWKRELKMCWRSCRSSALPARCSTPFS